MEWIILCAIASGLLLLGESSAYIRRAPDSRPHAERPAPGEPDPKQIRVTTAALRRAA